MARRARLLVTGVTLHLMQRGNNRMDIFRSPSDYDRFRYLMHDAASRFQLHIHCYVLMTNHVHLMATAHSSTAIPAVMHLVGGRYAAFFNRRYDRTGSLFEGRYRSILIETEPYWYACMRYIEQNPVRAGLVQFPSEYRWSSFRANALGSPDSLVVPHPLYLRLGDEAPNRCEAWRRICETPLPEEELTGLRLATEIGVPFGGSNLSPAVETPDAVT